MFTPIRDILSRVTVLPSRMRKYLYGEGVAHTTFYCIMATSQVLFRILLLVVAASETQSVPVYERYETCVASQQSDYQNPFNYTEVAIFGQIILARSNRCCDLPQVITQGVFSGPDGNIIVDGYKTQH